MKFHEGSFPALLIILRCCAVVCDLRGLLPPEHGGGAGAADGDLPQLPPRQHSSLRQGGPLLPRAQGRGRGHHEGAQGLVQGEEARAVHAGHLLNIVRTRTSISEKSCR